MRLVFGVASAMGLGENLSGVLGGIFVPPGAEEYNEDYGDDDLIVPDIFWSVDIFQPDRASSAVSLGEWMCFGNYVEIKDMLSNNCLDKIVSNYEKYYNISLLTLCLN